jgi:hypothetical protein
MPNHRRKILTVAEEMMKKKTERYILHDKSWMEKYEPVNKQENGDNGKRKQKEGKKCQVKRKK